MYWSLGKAVYENNRLVCKTHTAGQAERIRRLLNL